MSKRIKYTDEPLGETHVIPDFLPSPADLAFREEGVKVTLALSKKSVAFFKAEAARHHTQYQRMIRRLLDAYVETQSHGPSARASRPARKPAAIEQLPAFRKRSRRVTDKALKAARRRGRP